SYPIESAINGAGGVRRISSSSMNGFSVVKAEFQWGVPELTARQAVTEKLSAVSGSLPAGVEQPVLGPQASILGEIMIIGLTSDSIPVLELRDIAERSFAPRISATPGVAQVTVMGGGEKQYSVVIHPQKLLRYNLVLGDVLANIEAMNRNIPGGTVTDLGRNYSVKTEINTTDTTRMLNIVAGYTSSGEPVRLADIASVTPATALPLTGSAAINGTSGVLLTVVKQHGASTNELTEKISAQLTNMLATYGDKIHADTELFRQSNFIDASISSLQISLLEGAAFVIVILFIFLMNVRTTIISIVAIPVSVIVTLLILYAMGISVNTMTLGGIAIAIGSLVDDAIVDVENVYRRLRDNAQLPSDKRLSVIKVVQKASAEVRLPILNSSLIIIASFMPLFFLDGIEGRMLIPLGVAFITALIASTVVALTLTPVLCVYMLPSAGTGTSVSEPRLTVRMRHIYTSALERALNHKKAILVTTVLLLAGSGVLLFTMGRDFLPPFNEGSLTVNITAPAGTSLEMSEKIGAMAEKMILSNEGVRSTARKTGRAELDEHSRGVNASEIEIAFLPGTSTHTRNEIAHHIRQQLNTLPGCVIEIGQPISHRLNAMLSGSEGQIAIKISGPDLSTLEDIGKQVKAVMEQTPGLVDISLPPVSQSPRITITPRHDMLAQYGVTPSAFSTIINAALNGINVGDVRQNGFTYSIIARYGSLHHEELQIEYLRDLPVDTRLGKVPLSMLAEISSTMGPNEIYRENISRQLVAGANVSGRDLRGAVNDLRKRVSEQITLPRGYMIDYGGLFESEERSSRTLALASLGALVLIMIILYHEFHSFGQTAIIMVNIPLAIIGGILLLWLTYRQVNIPAIIGFISLLGISTRNGMLLMSRYNHLRATGMSLHQTILVGSGERLLPIVMTALTSALALIPLALRGDEPGNEIQSPMAVVILGGLITSTILNVFVVPVLYSISQKKKV
ncbi:MAG: efflux RND transporter permease subunit, partial [Paramuribaculum sp.]|nr:efflux RND transporter permease subunit [Paramuribaculum sp.]